MNLSQLACSLTTLVGLCVGGCHQGTSPDLIVYNGTLLTMDEATQGATAFAVKDGNILEVGSDPEVLKLAGPSTELLNLKGQALVPGFNDAHCHSLGLPVGSVEIGDVSELGELEVVLKKAASRTPPGEWVVAHGYDDTNFGGHLSRTDLDGMGIDHPILLIHGSLHLFLVNSKALENAGIDAATPDPEDGFYRRDNHGQPTGLIGERSAQESLFVDAQPSPYPHGLDSTPSGLRNFMKLALKNGITSYSEALVPPELALVYWWIDPAVYGVRVNLMFDGQSLGTAKFLKRLDEVASVFGWRPLSNEWLRGRTVKVFHGLSLSGRTARLHDPYADRPDYRGEEVQRSQSELDALVEEIDSAGFQAAIHANGDYEIDMVLDAYERVGAGTGHRRRHRIEHGSIVNARIMARMRDLGVVLAPHSYVYEKGPMMEAYGAERWPWMFANASTFEYGVPNAANSDYPVSALSPLRRIQSLVTRQSRSGKVYGQEQRLSVEQALYAYTMGGAYASFEEDMKGSISPNKFADFTILSADPRAVPPRLIHAIDVLATYTAGVRRYPDVGSDP